MARNRQRAKERKQRGQPGSDAEPLDDGADDPIVEPAIAGGAPPDDLGTAGPPVDFDADDDGDPEPDPDDESVRERVGPGAGDVAVPPVAKKPALTRIIPFIRACAAELQRVQWPDRKQVGQATAVVLGFVIVAGAFLGLADVIAQRIVDLII